MALGLQTWAALFRMVAILATVFVAPPAKAENLKRAALVLGNSDYQFVSKLENPANDAQDIAAALTRLGFSVTTGVDLDYNQMRLAVRDFADKSSDADVVILYFAGHGIEIDNTNYLIPVNAQLKSDRDVDFEAIRLDSIVDAIADAPGLKIVLVDACRNNPFLVDMERTSATRSIGRGLARVDPSGVLVGYSARGGTLALDGDGRNSPYAQAILRHIEEPGLEIGKLFRKVRDSVFEMTDGAQEPFTYGSLPGEDIYLVAAPTPSIAVNGQPTVSAAEARLVEDFAKIDVEPSLDAWNKFLQDYATWPDHSLVRLATARRDALQVDVKAKQGERDRQLWLDTTFAPGGRATALTAEDRALIQRSLAYMGHEVGPIDGEFGPKSLRAISAARFKAGLSPGTFIDETLLRALPDPRVIDALKSPTARVYGLEELAGGTDPRLRRAIEAIGSVNLKFDYYEGRIYVAVLDRSPTWNQASMKARQAGGHLVTIANSRENQFLAQLLAADTRFFAKSRDGSLHGPFIGLFQVLGSSEPSGGWAWETGEPVEYMNWSQGQPDNLPSFQDFAHLFGPPGTRASGPPRGTWADTSGELWRTGYIVEIK